MNYVNRLFDAVHLGGFLDKIELRNERAMEAMVYAYIKCMPLVATEMGMRQNLQDIGSIVRIPNFNNKPAWGAWLTLSVTSYIVDIPRDATIYMFDAWNVVQRIENGPGSFMAHLRGRVYTDFHSLRSETSVARIVITTQYEEDGEQIKLRFIDPLVNEYTGAITTKDYTHITVNDADPVSLTGREYFALANTLVSANPTKDARITRGLNYTDAAPATVLEEVRKRALRKMHIATE